MAALRCAGLRGRDMKPVGNERSTGDPPTVRCDSVLARSARRLLCGRSCLCKGNIKCSGTFARGAWARLLPEPPRVALGC